MTGVPPRGLEERLRDTRAKLASDVDLWVATSGSAGGVHLIPLSYLWDGTAFLISTPRASPTMGVRVLPPPSGYVQTYASWFTGPMRGRCARGHQGAGGRGVREARGPLNRPMTDGARPSRDGLSTK